MTDQMNKAKASQEAAAAKGQNLGNVDRKSLLVGGAGQGGGLGLNDPNFVPKVTGPQAAKGKTIDVAEDVTNAWAEVMDDTSKTAWVFCEYTANSKAIVLKSKGEGGLSEFKKQLGDDLGWGAFRCYGVDKRGGVECKRPKFVFVMYKAENASAMKKGRQGSHKGDVKEALSGAHLDLVVESLADLDEQDLIKQLQAATGAHKPNGYEFEEGVFLDADYYGLGIGANCKGENSTGVAA